MAKARVRFLVHFVVLGILFGIAVKDVLPCLGRRPRTGASAGPAVTFTTSLRNPFEVLGVQPDACSVTVKRAFRRFAKKYHPDVKDTGDSIKFQAALMAVKVLSTQEGRSRARAKYGAGSKSKWDSDEGSFDNMYDDLFKEDPRDPITKGMDDFDVWFEEVYSEEVAQEDRAASEEEYGILSVMKEWVRRKNERRQRPVQQVRFRKAAQLDMRRWTSKWNPSETNLEIVTMILAGCFGRSEDTMDPKATLIELQFFDEFAVELAQAMMELEDAFDVELAELEENDTQIKFDLPPGVESLRDFTGFIESKIA